ncbi:unnamed protein product [Peniophora sp. CBMAI 1063]|nr:unnamed protein product [Peniophora sp. CBMAI 1063]
MIPDIAPWIRHLSIGVWALNRMVSPESTLPLRSLNLVNLNVYLQGNPMPSSLIDALPHSLRVLRVISLAHINPASLTAIARRCQGIQELEISVADTLDSSCCLDCFAESESRVVHSPIGHGKRAQTIEQVVDAYADALQHLPRLRRLALGVFISPAALLTTHLNRHRVDAQPYITDGTPAYDTASAQHTPAAALSPRVKTGDYQLVRAPPATNIIDHVARFGHFATPSKCMDCVREYSVFVRRDELRATVRLAQRLKSLESVWWSSWFSGDDRTGALWTKLSVVREDKRLKVARQRRA